jgi:hypothetical protein
VCGPALSEATGSLYSAGVAMLAIGIVLSFLAILLTLYCNPELHRICCGHSRGGSAGQRQQQQRAKFDGEGEGRARSPRYEGSAATPLGGSSGGGGGGGGGGGASRGSGSKRGNDAGSTPRAPQQAPAGDEFEDDDSGGEVASPRSTGSSQPASAPRSVGGGGAAAGSAMRAERIAATPGSAGSSVLRRPSLSAKSLAKRSEGRPAASPYEDV